MKRKKAADVPLDPKTLLPRTPFLLEREAAIRAMANRDGVKLEEIENDIS